MTSFIKSHVSRGRSLRACVGSVAIAALSIGGVSTLGVSVASAKTSHESSSPPLVVWYDTPRVPYKNAYMKTHPGANIDWVLYNGNSNGTGVLQSKFALWNRTGWPSNAPNVMFDTQNSDAPQLASAPYNDLLNLKPYVPASVLGDYAGQSLHQACGVGTQIICLRNDNAGDVLWINTQLWSQFFPGQAPPTTWAGILQDSVTLQKNHPGYLSGDVGDNFDEDLLLWANECPLNKVIGVDTIEINPHSSNCTTISKMIDSAGVIGNSWSTASVFSSNFPLTKVVMMVGPLWYGVDLFQTGATGSVPKGVMAAYPPPPATNGAKVTGALGGGLWLVANHTPSSLIKQAVAFAQYMSTSPVIQNPSVDAGLPDYVPDQKAYVKGLNSVFAHPATTESAWITAAASIWPGWSPVPWSTDAVWAETALANLANHQPFAAQLEPYAENLANQARLAGYTVKSPDKNVLAGG